MSSPATNTLSALQGKTPMIGPDGGFYAVPLEAQDDAVQHNYKPAVLMKSDTGELHAVPHESVSDALSHKWTLTQTSGAPTEVPEWYGFTPSNIAKNLYEGVKSVAQGAGAVAKDLVQNPNWVEGDNSTLHKFVEQPMLDQSAKAAADLSAGNTTAGVGHAIAGGIPVVGPFAASLAEQAGTGDIGGAAAKGAAQVVTPMVAGKVMGLAKDAASPLIQSTAERMYQSTLKPSLAKSAPVPAELVKTGLQNEIPISKNGLDKLSGLIDDLQQKVSDTIASDPTRQIDPNAVATRADTLKPKFSNQVNSAEDLNAIEDSKQQFLKEQGATPGKPAIAPQPTGVLNAQGQPVMSPGSPATPATPAQLMSPADAQAMKVGTYRQLKGKAYGEMKTASIEAQKALARGLKEELVQQFPELSTLNSQEGKLIDLDGALEKAVSRIDNHQLIGIGTPLAMGAGGVVAGGTGGMVAGIMKGIIDNPVVKSKLAIGLSKAARGNASWADVNAKVGAYSAALGNAASAPTNDDQKSQQ